MLFIVFVIVWFYSYRVRGIWNWENNWESRIRLQRLFNWDVYFNKLEK